MKEQPWQWKHISVSSLRPSFWIGLASLAANETHQTITMFVFSADHRFLPVVAECSVRTVFSRETSAYTMVILIGS